ncbi:hypothetical protein [Roseovarius sp. TE539]|uniref:hypothetical protein n=1 Tax=Roseovarius sp. TE539 TaxID=2249812 RepID=UPI0011BE47C7|nr:hypothetical protein [Roseovarius sp. TE539]
MASSTNGGAQSVRNVTARDLANRSDLFEHGEITALQDENSFILRLNAMVHARRPTKAKTVSRSLAEAIRADKKQVKPEAELVLFGRWLLLDGRPGAKTTPGTQPNCHEIAKCVAACLIELEWRKRACRYEGKTGRDMSMSSRARISKRNVSKHDLSKCWPRVFGVEKKPAAFDSRLRSMRRFLSDYLRYLDSGGLIEDGKTVTKSPEIQAVLRAISGKADAQPVRQNARPAPVPATPDPFTIPLRYSSPEKRSEYRGVAGRGVGDAVLDYRCASSVPTSQGGKMRADRAGKLELKPANGIRGNYRVAALVDRIAILLRTVHKRDEKPFSKEIETQTGTTVMVRDLTKPDKKDAWGKPLPVPELGKSTGYHFGILIQDPVPDTLTAILTAVRDGPGISGDITIHMIEVAVDFHPATEDPAESVLRREEMVGLLQRHHWSPHSCFMDTDIDNLRHVDARQIFDAPDTSGDVSKVRFLFPDRSSSKPIPDSRIGIEDIRRRILTSRSGEDLHLDSTLAKGGKRAFGHVTVQHKIADQRNREKQTKIVLPDRERRARVEVTLSGHDTLAARDLETIDDLGKVSFRRLTRPFLSFKLASVDPLQYRLDDAQAQMHTRGVHGLELRHRARAFEERAVQHASARQSTPPNDREGLGLTAWPEMNDVVGKALDELTRRWRGFSGC